MTVPLYITQSDRVERSDRTLKTVIAMYIDNDQAIWDQHIDAFRHAINTSKQSPTKISPAFLNMGRHSSPPNSLRRELEDRGPKQSPQPEEWAERMKKLQAVRDFVTKNIDKAQQLQEKQYNKEKRDVRFIVGDKVWRREFVLSNAANNMKAKLVAKYFGPYSISEVLSPTVYLLDSGDSRQINKVHV